MAENREYKVKARSFQLPENHTIGLTDAQAAERMHNLRLHKKGRKGEPGLYEVKNPIEFCKGETILLEGDPTPAMLEALDPLWDMEAEKEAAKKEASGKAEADKENPAE